MAGLATWGLLEGLQFVHSPIAQELVNSSIAHSIKERATTMVQAMTHRSVADYCARSECKSTVEKFDADYVNCYSAGLCASMAEKFEFKRCKAAFDKLLSQNMQIQQRLTCTAEKAQDFFCVEETIRLLLESPSCYVSFVAPAQGACSQECVHLWKAEEAKHPYCVSLMDRQTSATFRSTLFFMRELLLAAKDPDARKAGEQLPKHFATFREACVAGGRTIQV
mmetsp:Transcript_11568/g.27741  ORF Transcript_11568/g.27741 Transcript_11568/m.27741 type:complete len:223 (+) Transcript_11568:178-846(+)